jgi:hypothetical protein
VESGEGEHVWAGPHVSLPVPWAFQETVNEFTDMTPAEFGLRLGYKKDLGYSRRAARGEIDAAPFMPVGALPSSVDWRKKVRASTPPQRTGALWCGRVHACARVGLGLGLGLWV